MSSAGRIRSCRQCRLQAALARHRSPAARLHGPRNCQAVHRRTDFLYDRCFHRYEFPLTFGPKRASVTLQTVAQRINRNDKLH